MLTQEQTKILALLGSLDPANIILAVQLATGLQIDIPKLLEDAGFTRIGYYSINRFLELAATKALDIYPSFATLHEESVSALCRLKGLQVLTIWYPKQTTSPEALYQHTQISNAMPSCLVNFSIQK
jgi:hypothetical protein